MLSEFAAETTGWVFPTEQSEDYQAGHGSPAGFAVCESVKELPRAAVAIANANPKQPDHFTVPNIVPRDVAHLALGRYKAIGLAFARHFGDWLRNSRFGGTLETVGPEKTLADIIPGEKTRRRFEAWLRTPTPLIHPSDIRMLDVFICHLFRHPGKVRTYELGSYLIEDLGWKPEAASSVVTRIDTSLELLRVDRKF